MTKRSAQTTSSKQNRIGHGQPARLVAPRLVLLGSAVTLVALGLVMVFSASAVTDLTQLGNAQREFVSQMVYVLGSCVFASIVALVPSYRSLVKAGPVLVMASAVLLVLTLAVGSSVNGSTRWISLAGFSFQPSEFAKIFIVLCATYILVKVPRGKRRDSPWFLGRTLLCLGVVVLIMAQPGKGTTFVTLIAIWVILVADGYPKGWMIALGFAGIGLYLLLALKDDYSRARLMAVVDPFADETGNGYQLVHGIFAFASGGIFGRGLGMSVQKYAYLPEAHNDFILAVIGEELGLLGVLFVFVCFGLLAWAGLKIAEAANDREGRYLAMGCVGLLVGQAALNFAGVLGIAPLTGKAVPFLSAGGSSMLASLGIVGLLVNISLRTKLQPTVYERRRSRFSLAHDSSAPQPASAHGYGQPHLRLVSSHSAPLERRSGNRRAFERALREPQSATSSRSFSQPLPRKTASPRAVSHNPSPRGKRVREARR